jgi:hypothetical protein
MGRGLIIKKEWLDRIFDNGKVWEMRSRTTKIRGRISLIESGSGFIVGDVTLTDCFRPTNFAICACKSNHQIEDIRLFKKWPYSWVLEKAKRYDKPIPYRHPQGAVIWVKLNNEPRPWDSN